MTPEEIMITTSGCHAMVLALMAILDPGDEVLLLEPYFSLYKMCIRDRCCLLMKHMR